MLHVPPDPVEIVVDYLTQQPDVVALGAGASTNLPDEFTSHITVGRIASAGYRDRAAWSDEAHLDVNCWAATEADASLLARTARAALMQIVDYRHRAGVITDVADQGGPGWLPDTTETPPFPRFIFSISITTHP